MIARRIWRSHRFLRPFTSSSICAPQFRVPEYHSHSSSSPASRPFLVHPLTGDPVEEFQPLCEVQSDKATIEITSRFKGKVALLSHTPGDVIKVRETLVRLAVEDAQDALLVTSDSSEIVNMGGSNQKIDNLVGALSTPAVRNLAKDLGIDINVITGTGKDGRVLKEDVLRFGDQKGFVTNSISSKHADIVGGDSISTIAI